MMILLSLSFAVILLAAAVAASKRNDEIISEKSKRRLHPDHPTGFTKVGKGRCVQLRDINGTTYSYHYPGVSEWFVRGDDSKCLDWCLTNPQDLLVGVEVYKDFWTMICYCAYSGWAIDKPIHEYNLDDYTPVADKRYAGYGGGEIEMRSAGYEASNGAVCYKNNDYYSTCQQIVDDKVSRSLESSGARNANDIVNGTEVNYGRYPYLVTVRSGAGSCGGTLVAYDVVLTAAHCVEKSLNDIIYVGINGHDKGNWEGKNEFVARVIVHPCRNIATKDHDVALLVLESRTQENVHLVKLNNDDTYPTSGRTATAMGWGTTSYKGSGSGVAMEVGLTVIDNSKCTHCINDIRSDKICTFEPGHGVCHGDSGGPLIIKGANSKVDVQIGIPSYVGVCASKDSPDVYARISHHYDWIRKNVCVSSSDVTTFDSCTGSCTVQNQEIDCNDGDNSTIDTCMEDIGRRSHTKAPFGLTNPTPPPKPSTICPWNAPQLNCSDPSITESNCRASSACVWRQVTQTCFSRRSKTSKNAKTLN